MIGRLRGKLVLKQPPHLILEVAGGIGYELEASMNTFYKLPDTHEEVILYTHLVVREDAQQLFGFYQLSERKLFRTLIKVNGVGPKLALTILSSIEVNDFVHCVANNDTASLVRLPGIGKKTAERLIIEMRDRLVDWSDSELTTTKNTTALRESLTQRSPVQDAISALIALGYKPQDASRAVSRIDETDKTSEEIIRLALREVA